MKVNNMEVPETQDKAEDGKMGLSKSVMARGSVVRNQLGA